MAQKLLVLNGTQNKKRLQQVPVVVRDALSLESYDPADPMVFEVSVADRDALWSFGLNAFGKTQVLL